MDGSFLILHFKIVFMHIQNCFELSNCYHIIELHLHLQSCSFKTLGLMVPSPVKIKDLIHKKLKIRGLGKQYEVGTKRMQGKIMQS